MSIPNWLWPIIAVIAIYELIRKNIMKFLLFVVICILLYFHKDVNEFLSPKPQPKPAEVATAPINAEPLGTPTVAAAPVSVTAPVIAPAAPAKKASAPEVKQEGPKKYDGDEGAGWLTKWLVEHTPKK